MSGNFPDQSGISPVGRSTSGPDRDKSGTFSGQSGFSSGSIRNFFRTGPELSPDKSGIFAGWEIDLGTGSGQVRDSFRTGPDLFPDRSGFFSGPKIRKSPDPESSPPPVIRLR